MNTSSYIIEAESFDRLSSYLYDLAGVRDALKCIEAAVNAQAVDFTVAVSAVSLAGDRLSTICNDIDGIVILAKAVTVNAT